MLSDPKHQTNGEIFQKSLAADLRAGVAERGKTGNVGRLKVLVSFTFEDNFIQISFFLKKF